MGVISPNVTCRRSHPVHRLNGTTHWTITEFDNGRRYMLTIECAGGVSAQAHFDGEQWGAFVEFVRTFPEGGEIS